MRVALQRLIDITVSEKDACLLEEYVNGDENLAVCRDTNDSSWESTFFETLGEEEAESEGDEQEQVQHFLEAKGHLKEAITVGSIVDKVSNLQLTSARQTTLDSWLSNAQETYLANISIRCSNPPQGEIDCGM